MRIPSRRCVGSEQHILAMFRPDCHGGEGVRDIFSHTPRKCQRQEPEGTQQDPIQAQCFQHIRKILIYGGAKVTELPVAQGMYDVREV